MITNSKKKCIAFRVSDMEYEKIAYEAQKRKLSEGQTARVVLFESLSGYDEKQESLLRRIDHFEDKLDERLTLLINIASIGAAAGALPLDADSQDAGTLRLILKQHFFNSSAVGKNLIRMIKEGKL